MSDKLLQQILLDKCGEDDYAPIEIRAWRMLVGCILLNQTSRVQVDRVYPKLFDRYPDPMAIVRTHRSIDAYNELKDMLEPLGLSSRRALTLQRFSAQWLKKVIDPGDMPDTVIPFYGCGQYAEHSWRIFVLGDMEVEPEDKELRIYIERSRDALAQALASAS